MEDGESKTSTKFMFEFQVTLTQEELARVINETKEELEE